MVRLEHRLRMESLELQLQRGQGSSFTGLRRWTDQPVGAAYLCSWGSHAYPRYQIPVFQVCAPVSLGDACLCSQISHTCPRYRTPVSLVLYTCIPESYTHVPHLTHMCPWSPQYCGLGVGHPLMSEYRHILCEATLPTPPIRLLPKF